MRDQGARNLVRAAQSEEGDGDGSGGAQNEKVLLKVREWSVQVGAGAPGDGAFLEEGLDGRKRQWEFVGDVVGRAALEAIPEISHAGGPSVEDRRKVARHVPRGDGSAD